MSRLEIRLLGGFDVWHDGRPINGFESQKVRALLVYLMLHRDSAHSRDRLAGLLWPEKDDDTARRNLRQAVYNLRTTLPNGDAPAPPILTSHQTIQFNPESDYWLDIEAFEAGVRRGMAAAGGVDPHHLEETTALYEAILTEEWPTRASSHGEGLTGVRIPFVGREAVYVRLRRNWEAVQHGIGRLTFVEGEAGVGKTRLVEEVIRHATSQTTTTVLRGCCYELAPFIGYQPFVEALRNAATEYAPLIQRLWDGKSSAWMAEVAQLVPELRALRPDQVEPSLPSGGAARQRLLEAVARFLETLAHSPSRGRTSDSLILFLDDLHLADHSTIDLLDHLVRRLSHVPIWIIAAYRPEELDPEHPLLRLQRRLGRNQRVDYVSLERLTTAGVEQIATALVGDEQASALARFLDRESSGLPLTVTELINSLCDQGLLVAHPDDRWTLAGALHALSAPASENLHELIMGRVSRLPSSARRLLTLAAVIGPRFDTELLQRAAGEHLAVVSAAIDIWFERRLARPVLSEPAEHIPKTAIEPHAGTARWRTIEFVHDTIRLAIYQDVSLRRRRVMHSEVAEALEERYDTDTGVGSEALAYHYLAAGALDSALYYLQRAGDQARRCCANEVARAHYDHALRVLDQLEHGATTQTERQKHSKQRLQVLASRSAIYGIREGHAKQKDDWEPAVGVAGELNEPDYLSIAVTSQETD